MQHNRGGTAGGLKILQINVSRCRAAHDLLNQVAIEREIDIILLSEPNKNAAKNENHFVNEEGSASIKVTGRTSKSSITRAGKKKNIVWVETQKHIICSMYISPNVKEDEAEEAMTDLLDLKRQTTKTMIVGGDLNAKSLTWNDSEQDKRGDMVEEYLASGGLMVCNRGVEPTFVRNKQTSHIDITMVDEKILCKINEWMVLDIESLSDHRYIEFDITDDVDQMADDHDEEQKVENK